MKPADHIRLAQLLREREAAFVTVWECELRIRQRLGVVEFPFPAPPDLPSHRRRPHPAPLPSRAAITVRRLRPGEDAYRLTCLYQGARCESLSDALDAVRALLAVATSDLIPLQLDTVALDSAGVPSVVDRLWSAAPSEPL